MANKDKTEKWIEIGPKLESAIKWAAFWLAFGMIFAFG